MTSELSNKKIISLEGNISAGKSSLLSLLSLNRWKTVHEPVDEWRGVISGRNILKKLYEDPKRWSFTFQTQAFFSRVRMYTDAIQYQDHNTIIFERSVFSDKYIFARALLEFGYMDDIEWNIYNKTSDWINNHMNISLDGIIYLRTSPVICEERLKRRNRTEENNISINYLNVLHKNHEKWLLDNETNSLPPVIVINGDADFLNNEAVKKGIISSISKFIDKL
ncbi:SWPV1-175 [Shearwaterpox virus]|uniref:SWPV1-175 n=1 Tax=Shearwaterpox virus TaxID=1974596 RepID=A0A1V0QGW0_CNPV|nr:SWPV1-175 [Shearwaterpox virus]